MPWFAFLLTLISVYITYKLYRLNRKGGGLKFLGLTVASAIFVVMQLSVFMAGLANGTFMSSASAFIVEWGHVVCLSFILSSLVIFIRESKPVFAQFPMIYTALPLLILLSYFLVKDTYALKDWLLAIYQGGAILVAFLMYGVYTYRKNKYAIILTGVFILFLSYLAYWYIPGVEGRPWIWKLLLTAGLITTIAGYQKVENDYTAQSSLQENKG